MRLIRAMKKAIRDIDYRYTLHRIGNKHPIYTTPPKGERIRDIDQTRKKNDRHVTDLMQPKAFAEQSPRTAGIAGQANGKYC